LSASPQRRGASGIDYCSRASLKTALWFDACARNQDVLRFALKLWKAAALLNLIEHLFAVHGDGARRAYSESNLFATHFQNRYLYVITDHNTLIGFSC